MKSQYIKFLKAQITVVIILVCLIANTQNIQFTFKNTQYNKSTPVAFKSIPAAKKSYKSLDKNLKKYALISLDTEQICNYIQLHKNEDILFDLVFPEIENFSLTLREYDILSPDYKLIVASESGKQSLNERKYITYEGNITNQENNKVRLTITYDIIYGIINV